MGNGICRLCGGSGKLSKLDLDTMECYNCGGLGETETKMMATILDLLHRAYKNNSNDTGWDEDYQNLIEQLNNK